MIHALEEYILSFIHIIPLPLFAFSASFIEEVVAPIPSPTIVILTGAFAFIQERSIFEVAALVLLATGGKTLGAWCVYTITDLFEDVITKRLGGFFGITHEMIKSLGNKLQGTARDYVILATLRALPFMPSVLLSVGAGALKIPMRLFLITTCIGTLMRDSFYIYIGYTSTKLFESVLKKGEFLELGIYILAALVVGGVLIYHIYRFRKTL